MISKYSYLTDKELIRMVQYNHGELIEELCERLAKLLETNSSLEKRVYEQQSFSRTYA